MAIEPGKELLWKYVAGQCESSEIAFVESWLKADPENQKELDRIRLYMSLQETNGDSLKIEKEKLVELKEKKPYRDYLLALILIIMVFILLALYSIMKN